MASHEDLSELNAVPAMISALLDALGTLLTITGLVFVGMQMRRAQLVNSGKFLLDLMAQARTHEQVRNRIRPSGDWGKGAGPQNLEEWFAAQDYVGFFELCETLLQSGSLSAAHFRRLFGAQLENLAKHGAIMRGTIGAEPDRWKLFESLLKRTSLSRIAQQAIGSGT